MEKKIKPKFILLEKTKALYTMVHPLLDMFPKTAKFTLRAKIEDTILEIIRLLILQNYKQISDEKKALMLDVIANIHLLNILLQQAMVFKYISYKNHKPIAELTTEMTAIAVALHRNIIHRGADK